MVRSVGASGGAPLLIGRFDCVMAKAVPRIKGASTEQDEHVAASGLLGRVMARLRGH
jgi:hypothetical protein